MVDSSTTSTYKKQHQTTPTEKPPLRAAPMDQQNNGSSSKPHPRPSYASMAARGPPPPPSPPNNLSRISYKNVFTDPTDGHLAHLTIPPMGLRPEEMMNPRAVAYKIPARYKVSAETFLDAAAESLSIEINPSMAHRSMSPFSVLFATQERNLTV